MTEGAADLILDPRTLLLMASLLVGLTGLALLLVSHNIQLKLRDGARSWSLASGVLALAWATLASEGILPELVTVLLGNFLYLVTATLIYQSLRLFDGLEQRREIYANVLLPSVVVALTIGYLFESGGLRVAAAAMALGVALLLGLSIYQLLGSPKIERRDEFGRRSMAFWLLGTTILQAVRAGLILGGGPPGALSGGNFRVLALGFGLVAMISVIFSYFLLYTGRITSELQRQANIDPLTGLYNRRAFEVRARREMRLATTKARSLALLLVDADRFKYINDEWGHAAGDQALRAISAALTDNLRSGDTVARFGGDEFAILLPDRNEEQARFLAHRLAEAVSESTLPYSGPLQVSIGVACLGREQSDVTRLLAAADRSLYIEKNRRRPPAVAPQTTLQSGMG